MDLVTYAAPIMLPTVMLLLVAVAGMRLGSAGIMLMFPEAFKCGAAVDVVCFDKTGTLTQSAVSYPLKASETTPSHVVCGGLTQHWCSNVTCHKVAILPCAVSFHVYMERQVQTPLGKYQLQLSGANQLVQTPFAFPFQTQVLIVVRS